MGNTDLSAGAKLTFGRLALYAGTKTPCFPSLGRLATDLGVSIDVVGRWLKELITAKLIRRTRSGPGRNAECEFIWNASLGTGDDSANLRNQDAAESRNLDSAYVGNKIPQIRGADSAEMRNAYKEQAVHEAVHLNGSAAEVHTQGARSAPASASSASLDLVLNASTSRLPADELQKPQSAARPKGVGAPKTENQSQNQKAEPAAGAIGVCLTSEERLFHEGKAGKPFWTEEDQILIWNALYAYMERDPPEALVQSCELRAAGATAQQVLELLKRKHSNPRYRCGRKYGPGGKGGNSYDNPWNWFLTVIGNEFQGQHFPEPKAKIDSALSREQFDKMTAALE